MTGEFETPNFRSDIPVRSVMTHQDGVNMKRIKYISRFNRDLSQKEIDDLIVHAGRNNEKLNITGILMTSGRLFFQVIEGPTEFIDELWERIREDDRHTDVLLLCAEENITKRIFPDWSLKRIALDTGSEARLEPIRTMVETIMVLRERIESMVHTVERAIWVETAKRE